ncbi:MAG TPA: hypothetical protein VFF06_33975 [Polyangia bacterium]|nr:hypothetical protein [Polyangia bacterium]
MSNPMPGDGCAKFVERLAALAVDGDEELERHIAACAACRREAERYRGLAERLRADEAASAAETQAPAALHDGILRAIAGAAPGAASSSPASTRRRPWRWPALAAGMAAAAALGWLMLARKPAPVAKRHATPAIAAPFEEDDDPCQLIGDLDDDEVARVSSYFKKGA